VLRKSFRSIARDLGVDQGTVRGRMRKFQEAGILRRWYLGVSPGLTGHNVGQAWLMVKAESHKSDVVESLLAASEVERVCTYLGPKVSLLFLIRRGANPDSVISNLQARAGSNLAVHRGGVVQVPTREVKQTDSAIIASLGGDPWKPYSKLAEEVGVSTKTIVRRVAMLSEDGAIYMLPDIDLRALQGIIPVELVVEYASQTSRAKANERISSRIGSELVFSDNSGPYGYFALVVPNLFHMEQMAKWANQLEGVREARVDALEDVVLNRTHYDRRRMPTPVSQRTVRG